MDLEPLVQRLSLEAAQFDTALSEAQRELRQTGRISDETTRRLASGFRTASASVSGSAGQIGGTMRRLRGSLQNVSFQIADIAQQLEAGVSPLRAFTVQGAQIAGAFGPAGAAIGAVVGVLGALASGLIGSRTEAEEAAGAIEFLTEALGELAKEEQSVAKVRDALVELSEEARRFARLEVQIELPGLEQRLAAARATIERELGGAIADIRSRERDLAEIGESIVPESQLERLEELIREFEAGQVAAIDVADALRGLPEESPLRALAKDALESARNIRDLETAVEAANAVLRATERTSRVLSTEAFGPPEAPAAAASSPGRTARAREPATFESIIGPLERENALLQEGLLTRQEVAALLRAEATLKRDLTEAEQQHLSAVLATGQGFRERDQAAAAQAREVAQIVTSTRTEQEAYNATLARLRELLDEGAISQEVFNRALVRAKAELEGTGATIEQVAVEYDLALDVSRQFAGNVAAGLTDAAFAGKGLATTIGDIGIALSRSIVEALALRAIMVSLGLGPSGGSTGAGLLGLFAGGAGGGGAAATGPAGPTPLFPSSVIPRQHGGPTLPGVSYLVGERGPELFVPRQAGSIVPGGGAAPQITIVDQRGAQAPPVEQTTDPRGAVSFIIRSEVTGMMRDGSLNRGLGVRQRGVARG